MNNYDFYKDSKLIYELFISFKNDPTKNKIDKLLPLLRENSLNVNSLLVFDYSLMHVKQGPDTMKYLLSLKGDVRVTNTKGMTPIFMQDRYDTIKLLVDKGCIPNIQDNYKFTPLFWQKEPEAMRYLLNQGLKINHFNTIFNLRKGTPIHDIYVEMFIIGGYDPYNEHNFRVSPLFLQRNCETQKIMLKNETFHNRKYHIDIFHETPLFKPCISKEILQLYLDCGENINNTNLFLNSLLYVHTNPDIILCLLHNGISLIARNFLNETPYLYHLKRNNIYICDLIEEYYSSTLIQKNCRRFIFRKNYVPLKNYKKKKELVKYIELLPPSECGIFPGGIIYQDSLEDFIQHQLLS
jgi:ankyrin repeat protein